MRRIVYLFLSAALLVMTSATMVQNTAYLNVKITNIASESGYVEIGLYNDSQKFLLVGKTHKLARVKPNGSVMVHKFTGLKPGRYAVCIYHDKNNDNRINKNMIGIPTEPYAFSNNFRPKFSAPDFSDCSFSLQKARMITIKMIN